jgi:hypothetical protein
MLLTITLHVRIPGLHSRTAMSQARILRSAYSRARTSGTVVTFMSITREFILSFKCLISRGELSNIEITNSLWLSCGSRTFESFSHFIRSAITSSAEMPERNILSSSNVWVLPEPPLRSYPQVSHPKMPVTFSSDSRLSLAIQSYPQSGQFITMPRSIKRL